MIRFDDGSSAFAKIATTSDTADWLRAEHRVYSQLEASYLARFLGWDDDGEAPILLLEDLSSAYWPPPWKPRHIEALLKALAEIKATPPPNGTSPMGRAFQEGWARVAEDPAPFLSLGLCSQDWLDRALDELVEAEARAPTNGNDLLHMDVRSDNVCFIGERAILVDWNHACQANGVLDVAAWLPSLHSEGGPLPEDVCSEAGDFAAVISGYFASYAGLPPIENAPDVRNVQLKQLQSALPWAIRVLGLPPLIR